MEQVSQKFQHFHTCLSLPPEYFVLADWCYDLRSTTIYSRSDVSLSLSVAQVEEPQPDPEWTLLFFLRTRRILYLHTSHRQWLTHRHVNHVLYSFLVLYYL